MNSSNSFGAFLATIGGLAVVAVLAVCAYANSPKPSPHFSGYGSAVKVVLQDANKQELGHGSGVYLGNGYVLTANHVVEGVKDAGGHVIVKTEKLDTVSYEAEVLWQDKEYDVALVRVPNYFFGARAHLACGLPDPYVGLPVEAVGSPLNLDFIRTFGHIASNVRSGDKKIFKDYQIVDISIAPGNSGGPLFSMVDGELLGITNAGAIAMVGYGGSFVGMSYIVPRSTLCRVIKAHGGAALANG